MKYCCDQMRLDLERTCEMHPNRHDCPDALIAFSPKSKTYGIMIHDGGSAVSEISYCPWCGTQLSQKR